MCGAAMDSLGSLPNGGQGVTRLRRGLRVAARCVAMKMYWWLLKRRLRYGVSAGHVMGCARDHDLGRLLRRHGHDEAGVGSAWIATILCRLLDVVIVGEDGVAATLFLPICERRSRVLVDAVGSGIGADNRSRGV